MTSQGQNQRSIFRMNGKALSQETYNPNIKTLSQMVQKLSDQGHMFCEVGHRSRSRLQVNCFCMSGKSLSQETYMPNMKALSDTVQTL